VVNNSLSQSQLVCNGNNYERPSFYEKTIDFNSATNYNDKYKLIGKINTMIKEIKNIPDDNKCYRIKIVNEIKNKDTVIQNTIDTLKKNYKFGDKIYITDTDKDLKQGGKRKTQKKQRKHRKNRRKTKKV
jgi:hypothetical protein